MINRFFKIPETCSTLKTNSVLFRPELQSVGKKQHMMFLLYLFIFYFIFVFCPSLDLLVVSTVSFFQLLRKIGEYFVSENAVAPKLALSFLKTFPLAVVYRFFLITWVT